MKLIKTAASFIMASALFASAATAHADVQSQLNTMFNNMSNTTAPGAYETASRGVLTGGSFRARNQIATTPLVSFRPPSVQAGCGGIDMFAGSFSYINAAQFVQTLRSVASNAVGVASGYAFKLALKTMCPSCESTMAELHNKVQALNEMFSNSCQLAQGIVTDTFSALGAEQMGKESTKSITAGLTDVFGSWKSGSDGKTSGERLNEAGLLEFCKDKGNILWCEMQRKGVSSSYQYGNRETQEMIMSLTGSYYVGELANADDGKGQTNENLPIPPTGVSMRDLIEGKSTDKVNLYDCSGDETACSSSGAAVPMRQVAFKGMGAMIVDAFNGQTSGGPASPGIIWKWSRNQGPFTASEKSIIGALNATGMSAMIQKLSQRSENMARQFVSTNANLLARQAIFELSQSYLLSARQSMIGSDMPYAKPVIDQINEAVERIRAEDTAMHSDYGNQHQMMQHYQTLMTIMPAAPTFATGQTQAVKSIQ